MYKSTNTFQPSRGQSGLVSKLNNFKFQLEFLHPHQFFLSLSKKIDVQANEKLGSFSFWSYII